MTLVLGLRCRDDGVVLASDSQRTEGGLRDDRPKLFSTPSGIIWGTAGSFAIQQELHDRMTRLEPNPGRLAVRDALVAAVRDARATVTDQIDDPSPAATTIEGLFAWYSQEEGRTFLVKILTNGHSEFAPRYDAVGSPHPRGLAGFALRASEHMEYATLPLHAGQMVAANIAGDVIRACSSLVGFHVQVAVVDAAHAGVLPADELTPLAHTVSAFRDHQKNFVVRDTPTEGEDTGVRP
ncbi:MAG: hypothetical protein QOH72_5546 [Solirubrobacteraceae bacterium]|jgi:hypothetical protein|nr:hypothetical protein [Solirubrobacteraceae bacterium]